MARDGGSSSGGGGAGGGGVRSTTTTAAAVINERLIRQGIEVERVGPAEDERTTRGHALLEKHNAADSRRAAAQQLELHLVTRLALSYRGIGRIDNLVGVDALTKLQLDNNRIATIENLGHLQHLVWLDLSFNQIRKIEGLDALTKLEDLSLYSNEIAAVEGMDTLHNLRCLSLGKNRITDLEATATYLHRFEKLRMLTLQGNRIEAQAHYKSRIVAFSRRIKFLDNRLVTQTEIDRASEEQRENCMPQEEEDARKKEEAVALKQRSDEDAEYAHANCPNPTERGLYNDIALLEPEGGRASIRQLIEVDIIKDKVKETVETYKEDFLAKAKELADRMRELSSGRDADVRDFKATLQIAKRRANDTCKTRLRAFEAGVKRVIPFGLRGTVDPTRVGPEDFDDLRAELAALHTELLEIEADTHDGFEAVITKFEDDMANTKAAAHEQLQRSFEELREVEKTFQQELKRRLDALSDDRQRAQQDAGDVFGGGGLESMSPAQRALVQLLESKDEYQKLLTEWGDTHTKRLDDVEEAHKKREEKLLQQLHEEVAQQERERNRLRISEIHAYLERMREYIDSHEQMHDNM